MLKTTRWLLLLLATAFAPFVFADKAPADPRIATLLGDLAKVRSISAAQPSPDGQQLAWVVNTGTKLGIEVAKSDGSNAHRIGSAPAGTCNSSDIAWAPDSQHLAFLSDCGNASRRKDLFVADTRGNEAQKNWRPCRAWRRT